MVLRHQAARCAALLLSVAAALLVTALPAAAATTGVFIGSAERGHDVKIDGQSPKTHLLALKLEDGTVLKTYCVELDVRARLNAAMAEAPWSEYPDPDEQFNAHPDKVLWILHNSYPNVALDVLGGKAGVDLNAGEAIAGTQAAIWHFSDGAALDAEGNADDVRALYAYLTGPANTGLQKQPPVSLSITPEEGAEAHAGKAAGPFTVDTTASEVELTVDGPDGVAVVDAGGAPLTEVKDGTQFWLSAPPDNATGEATVQASAKAEVATGRLFVGVDNAENPTQTLIVAASSETRAKAEASAKWVPAPEQPPSTAPSETAPPTAAPPPQGGTLPETGASVLQALGLALLLLGAGIGALLLQRHNRTSE